MYPKLKKKNDLMRLRRLLNDTRRSDRNRSAMLHYDMYLQKSVKAHMSLVMRKPAFCICENKAADQLRGNREADQRLCFRYIDRTIPSLPKSEFSSLQSSAVTAQPSLCLTWSEIPKTGFLTTRHISKSKSIRILVQVLYTPLHPTFI